MAARTWHHPAWLIAFSVALAAILASIGCAEKRDVKTVSLKSSLENLGPQPQRSDVAPLRVGIAAVVSPKETFRSYQELLTYLGRQLGQPVDMIQRNTYAEMNDLIRTGEVDLAFVCTEAYVLGNKEFGMKLVAVPQVNGEPLYYSYLIVHRDSGAQGLDDLRGKTFAFTDPMSTSGRLVPVFQLWRIGEKPDTFFKKSVFTYSHDNSVKAVAERLVDGAAVDSLVYDYLAERDPEYASRTKVIGRYGPFGSPPVVVHPSLDPELRERLSRELLNVHNSNVGRQILRELRIDRFVTADDRNYDPVREMLSTER